MTASSRLSTLLAMALLAGCAAAPAPAPDAAASPFVTSTGLVIGTLSYQYVEAGAQPETPWVVHFERIDAPAQQEYELTVDVDPRERSGVFAGALPAGVYAFREAASDNRRFQSGALRMPFEVQAGAVQDAGHYALNPILTRP
jgi:hypothetical protein